MSDWASVRVFVYTAFGLPGCAWHLRAFVRSCVRAYVRSCVRASVRTCVRASVRSCVRAFYVRLPCSCVIACLCARAACSCVLLIDPTNELWVSEGYSV